LTILNSTFCGVQVCNQLNVVSSASELAEQWLDTIKHAVNKNGLIADTQRDVQRVYTLTNLRIITV